jgi:hypothetical protein
MLHWVSDWEVAIGLGNVVAGFACARVG